MSNPNIGKEASKGGKARWKGVSKKAKREQAQKAAWIRWALNKKAVDKAGSNSL